MRCGTGALRVGRTAGIGTGCSTAPCDGHPARISLFVRTSHFLDARGDYSPTYRTSVGMHKLGKPCVPTGEGAAVRRFGAGCLSFGAGLLTPVATPWETFGRRRGTVGRPATTGRPSHTIRGSGWNWWAWGPLSGEIGVGAFREKAIPSISTSNSGRQTSARA